MDVKSRFDDASGRKAADEAKRYFDNAGDSSGTGFMSNFARAVEKDTKVRAAADKVANSLDKITAAEAKRATQLEKSKAVNEAVAAAEKKLNDVRASGDTDATAEAEKKLTSLREKQTEINNKLVVSATAVSRAERDRSRAVREASQAYRDMGNDVDSLGDKLAKLGSAGGAVKLNLGLAALGTLPAAATGIAEVAGALQQLAGAGLAVPGIFAGIASSVAVGALGMRGMSDAITAVDKASDGTKASVEAANKALADLPASTADVAKTVVGLKGTFTDLQGIASTNMFAGVSDGLKGLVGADLPVITRGVDGISQAINGNLLQAMSSLGSQSSQGFLDKIFGNTADAQGRLTKAIDPAINAIGRLAATGSNSLPRLADAVGDVANRFDRFISAADGDGRLDTWIDKGLTGFTQLGNAVLNIGTSFTGITQAAGGGAGLLGTLESATAKMSTFLNSAEGQAKLRTYFAEGRDMLGQLKDVATTAGPVLAGVFQAGIGAANIWLPVISRILTALEGIPGGATAAVTAFVAWKTMTGAADLLKTLSNVGDTLGGLGPKAQAAGGAMDSALKLAGPIAAAFALQEAYKGVLSQIDKITGTNIATQADQMLGPGNVASFVWGQATGNPQEDAARAKRDEALNRARLNPVPLAPGSISSDTLSRKDDMRGVPDSVLNPPATPGMTGFTAPVITEPGSGSAATPFIDPSKYQMGDPLAGLPAAVAGADPTKVYDTDSKVLSAAHNVEQQRLANQVLEAKGNATQAEILAAKYDLQEKERALYDAQNDAIKARTAQMSQATSDLSSVFVPLDQGFGISGGIPGVVENLTKLFGNLAMAGAMAASPAFRADAQTLAANGGVAAGLFNQQYFTGSGAAGSAAPSGYAGAGAGGGAYPGDAALLSRAPRGIGQYDQGTKDLSRGLVDCASGVEDLVNIMDGKSTVGGSLWTGNASSVLPGMGFQRGMGGPGDFRIGYNSGHMQATLPGGSNVNYGSTPAIRAGGLDGGEGAYDPSFTDHWFRPAGASYAPAGGAGASGVPATAGLAGGGGTQSVYVVNMPTGGILPTGGPAAPGSVGDPASALGPTPLGGGVGPDIFSPADTSPGLNNPITTGVTSPSAGGGGGGWGIPGIPAGITGGGGQGPVFGAGTQGMAGRGAGAQIGAPTGGPAGGTGVASLGSPGGSAGADGGGALGAAASMFPGGGVAAALAARTVKYGAQALAIGAQGVMDTILPAGSPLAANSWFSKLAGGLSGAKPAKPNNAGGQGGNPQQAPAMPGAPAGGGQGGQQKGGDTNINVTTAAQTDQGTANAIAFHQQAANQGSGN